MIWVSVQVLAARNLLARDKAFFGGGGSSDPYVKLKYKKINTIKSEWIEKTCNPSWCALLLVHTQQSCSCKVSEQRCSCAVQG